MDLWVVAAAAGAGYIAKNLQNLEGNKKESFPTSSYSFQSESRNFLQQLRDRTCPLRRLAEESVLDASYPGTGVESDYSNVRVSEGGYELGFRNWESGSGDDSNLGWVSSLPTVFSSEGSSAIEERKKKRGRPERNRRRGFYRHRPLNSLGRDLDVQECSEHGTVDDTPCSYPSMRPVLVTDWRGMHDGSGYLVEEFQRKTKGGLGNLRQGGSGEGASGEMINAQGHSTMLLFITGMILGILSATTAWKTEVDKLNKVLKQMQSLVQDLQDELEMKEMLMVKELPAEGHPSPGAHCKPLPVLEPFLLPSDVKSTKFEILKACDKHAENLELLSTIEAELQAELETLENNMNTTSTIDQISGIVELDPDFEPEIVRGDLKPALVNDPLYDSQTESTNASTTNYSQPANYSVSPWELSLRLHELIESRLESRIKELETALTCSLNRAQVLDSENAVSEGKFSRSETESSSIHQSPSSLWEKREHEPSADDPSRSYANGCRELNGILPPVTKQDRPVDLTSTSFMSNVDSESDDDEGDESEMMLIKRIVERRRSSSNFKVEIDWGSFE